VTVPGLASLPAALRAHARDGTTAYLQVEAGNAAARRASSKLGCWNGHACWYRRPPAEEIT
jgi:hypothetical protein